MKFLHLITLFATLGLVLARDFFANLGFEATLPMIGALGLAISTLLIFQGILPIIAVAILAVMVRVPEEALQQYRLDHDILLGLALTIVLFPWLRKLSYDA